MRYPLALVFAFAIVVSEDGAAQTPPCTAGVYHDFDFWVGEWVVHTPQGELAGHNSISREEGACLLVERWRGARGGSGQSYNFYDPAAKAWRQVWVSPRAIIDYSGGLNEAGAMYLQGSITAQSDGRQTPFRGTWTLSDDGSVEQHLEILQADKGGWQTWFRGIYSPVPLATPATPAE